MDDLAKALESLTQVPQRDIQVITQEILHAYGGAKQFGRKIVQKLESAPPGSMMETRLLEKVIELMIRSQPKDVGDDDLSNMTVEDVERELAKFLKKDAAKEEGNTPGSDQ